MSAMRAEALELLCRESAQVARWCGFDRLTDSLHGAWMRQMIEGSDDMTILAHRGSYKTTCLTVVIATLLCVQPEKTILFLRKTDDDVAEVLRQVKTILQSDAFRYLTREIYGSPVAILRGTNGELITDCYASPRGAVQLLGQGIGGSLTGKHADIIFTDDIVNLQDRLSRAERQHTVSIYQELQNIRNPGGRIINTGTPWHLEDAISRMPNVQRFDCYATGLLTPQQIDNLRQSMEPSLFAANYELRHIAQEGALITTPPVFTDDETLLRDGIAHIDAAYQGEDYTAFTCGCFRGGRAYLYGRLWHTHVDEVLPEIAAECRRLLIGPIHCELNADKGYLARELKEMGLLVRSYTERTAKSFKIGTYLRKWWPRVTFLRGTDPRYLSQLLDYTPDASHDDAPDSAACILRLFDRQDRLAMRDF